MRFLHLLFAINQPTFKAPIGNDPVSLDLEGLGRGFVWVNDNDIGRYWPSFIAQETGCSTDACDYRGRYDNKKCAFNCGKPTQK
ncbi:Galactose-binding domain-like protein [Cynara cardunculus var. scolymus]|uniref:Galactose-binding domain-like protein n=1 Tax=Cynara cardunculus var. scolymus TaxID=59895 RepID=A0A118K7C8_CYNCS|nr:Galactose-binding domain-like protein [Cynara cardunculus var. scolymus]